jgi:hypothetical protein
MTKAIRIHKTGGPEVLKLEDVQLGEPGEGQVRLKHTAIGLNFIDCYHRSGLYPVELPLTLGSEAQVSSKLLALASKGIILANAWLMLEDKQGHIAKREI